VAFNPELPLKEQEEEILTAIKKGISTGQFVEETNPEA
jgi:hypothetical protein